MDVYSAAAKDKRRRAYIMVKLQEGPITPAGVNGCLLEDVIEVLLTNLREVQTTKLACHENDMAIWSLEEAANWLLRRRMNRIEQGVEGTSRPHESP